MRITDDGVRQYTIVVFFPHSFIGWNGSSSIKPFYHHSAYVKFNKEMEIARDELRERRRIRQVSALLLSSTSIATRRTEICTKLSAGK